MMMIMVWWLATHNTQLRVEALGLPQTVTSGIILRETKAHEMNWQVIQRGRYKRQTEGGTQALKVTWLQYILFRTNVRALQHSEVKLYQGYFFCKLLRQFVFRNVYIQLQTRMLIHLTFILWFGKPVPCGESDGIGGLGWPRERNGGWSARGGKDVSKWRRGSEARKKRERERMYQNRQWVEVKGL